MKDYETGMERVKRALSELGNAASEVGLIAECLTDMDFERMKNCANCDHNEVCLVVAQRKARKANDYSACSKWKLVEKK